MQIYKNKTHKKILKKYVQTANNFDVFFKKNLERVGVY